MPQLARTLMIQGTASSVGKSLLTAALCRIFARRGVRVAPFKAQNMALNAAVTPDWLEIGRAQAVQAAACGLRPRVEMNPVLLKPEGEQRCQVVLRGRPMGRMSAQEYFAGDRSAIEAAIVESLDTMRREHELVILEGAGSPVELNLKARDLCNMHAARLADAPVLLVGDIDRGGVFASLIGTLSLLEPSERARVAGLIINKFRGDLRLFDAGRNILEQRTQKPLLGVVPHLPDLHLPEEDSVSLEQRTGLPKPAADVLDIVVVQLPRTSNYDDVLPLEREPGVCVRFSARAEDLYSADLVIVPGSKSTVADLAWLRAQGLDQVLVARAREGRPIFGICGGYQMLGERIEDPGRIEADVAQVRGLGLLPITTEFVADKRTAEVCVQVRRDARRSFFTGPETAKVEARGYVIHHGVVRVLEPEAQLFVDADGRGASARAASEVPLASGAVSPNGRVVGTSVHGFLEEPALRAALLGFLRDLRGLAAPSATAPSTDAAFDRLADAVEGALDLAKLAEIVGLPLG